MAVLCLLTNTPWPWPTPAGAASARGGVHHPERSGGRPQAGLHKRSAEDWGASCARQGRSPSGRLGFLAVRGAQKDALFFGRDSPRFYKRFQNGILHGQGSVDAVWIDLAGHKNSVAPRSTPAERGTSWSNEQPQPPIY